MSGPRDCLLPPWFPLTEEMQRLPLPPNQRGKSSSHRFIVFTRLNAGAIIRGATDANLAATNSEAVTWSSPLACLVQQTGTCFFRGVRRVKSQHRGLAQHLIILTLSFEWESFRASFIWGMIYISMCVCTYTGVCTHTYRPFLWPFPQLQDIEKINLGWRCCRYNGIRISADANCCPSTEVNEAMLIDPSWRSSPKTSNRPDWYMSVVSWDPRGNVGLIVVIHPSIHPSLKVPKTA